MNEPILINIKGHEKVIDLIKNYHYLKELEKNNVDKFIYSLLKCPRDYEDYIKLFFNKVLIKQIKHKPVTEKLLNKFIIEASQNIELYNKYIKKVLKMDYNKYCNSVDYILNNHSKLIDNYVKTNINKLNFDNNIEMKIMDDYIIRKLSMKSRLASKDIRIIVKFLIEYYSYKMELKTKINTITFIENLNKEKFNIPTILQKTKTYLKVYGICNSDFFHDGIITINTDNFKIHKTLNLFLNTRPLFDLLLTCFHELQHAKQNNISKLDENGYMTLNYYKKSQELFIVKNDYDFYYKHHDKFYSEIDADIFACEQALNFLKKYSKERYNEIRDYGVNYLSRKILAKEKYNDIFLIKQIDFLVKQNPDYVKDNIVLQLEYNEDGSKKSILGIVEQLNLKKVHEDVIYYIIIKTILGNNFDVIKNHLKNLPNSYLEVVKQSLLWEVNNMNNQKNITDDFQEKYINLLNLLKYINNKEIIPTKQR